MTRTALRTVPSLTPLALGLVLLAAAAAPAAAAVGTWSPTALHGNIQALAVAPGQPGIVYAAVQDQGLFRSADGGATWTAVDQGLFDACFPIAPDIYLLAADPRQPGTLYAETFAGLKKTIDGGAHWFQPYDITLGGVSDLTLVPGMPGRLLAAVNVQSFDPPGQCLGGGLAGLAVSDDGGANWSNPVVDQILSVAADPAHVSRIFTEEWKGMPRILLSEDGGTTSTVLPALPSWFTPGGQDSLRVDPTTAPSTLFVRDRGYPGQEPGTIYRAAPGTDGAGSSPFWTLVTSGLPANTAISGLLLDPAVTGRLYAATDGGVFVSNDRGDSWTASGDANPPAALSLAVDPRTLGPLYAGTSQGVYVLDRGGCSADDAASCLHASRFRVRVGFRLADGTSGIGHAVPLSDAAAAFWFFGPANLELLVKVLDGRPVNGSFWVFSGGLSNVRYTLTVTDVVTGAVKTYVNPAGKLSSFADTAAFADPQFHAARAVAPAAASVPAASVPAASVSTVSVSAASVHAASVSAASVSAASVSAASVHAASVHAASAPAASAPAASASSTAAAGSGCAPGATGLCLDASRFRVEVAFQAPGLSGTGQAAPLTADTGAMWFLSPENLELAVKVLDGRALNGHFWLFSAGMSDFRYTITVTDTATGAVKTYTNPSGHVGSFADTQAF
jgi:hypothetical protein